MRGFLHVNTGGAPREMGFDLGRAVADVLVELRAESVRHFRRSSRRSFAGAVRHARARFLPAVARRYPAYLEEARGIAEGARMPFDDFFALTAEEELLSLWERREHCSSAAVRAKGGLLLLHNEDYPSYYRDRLIVVRAEPSAGPAFLALTYPYMVAGPSCGLNSAGLALAINSLSFRPKARGIPTNYVLRDLYAARDLGGVRRRMDAAGRLMGNCAVAVSAAGKDAVAVEASPDRVAVLRMGRAAVFAHTNHAVSDVLAGTGERPAWNSRLRKAALEHLLTDPAARTSIASLGGVLSSAEHGLLRLPKRPGAVCTIASAVLDPAKGTMYVAKRGRGGHGFKAYRLR